MTRRPVLEDLGRLVDPGAPALAPDGAHVVYTLGRHDADGRARSELWRLPAAGGVPERLTEGAVDAAPAFSPDGREIAFVRTVDGTPTLHRMPADGGEPVALTSGISVLGVPEFSPDGGLIAIVALVDDDDTEPRRPLVVAGDPMHKVDGLGWLGGARTQILILPAGGGDAVRLRAEGYCSAPAWSPDGRTLAFAQRGAAVDGVRFASRVGLVDIADPGAPARFPFAATGVSGPLAWTPDGASVIVIGDLTVRVGLARLVRLDIAGGGATVLTGDLDRNVMGGGPGYPGGRPAFSADGRLVFCVRDGGQTVLVSMASDASDLRRHEVGDGVVVSSLSVRGSAAVVRVADAVTPGELARVDLDSGETTRLTDHVAQALPGVGFAAPEPVSFTISDGVEVAGWLLRGHGAAGPAPTLLDIHGGPHNAWTGTADAAHLYHQILASRGWNVLTLNPRGSDGYGEDFYRGAIDNWGAGDEKDFLESLDQLVDAGIADPERLAVTGYSYGGFMTCWLTARTDRFRSAVPGGLVCDHHAMNASSDLGAMLRDLEIGGSREVVRLSPITYVDDVATPTLILHGQDDLRCPLAQAELWYARLRDGGVEAEMVVYPGGSHVFLLNGPLAHREDYNRRVVDWVTAHDAR